MNLFGDLMITALYTAFFQNLVLSFAYGSSEAVRISLKPRTFGMFTAMISGFAVISAAICRPVDRLPSVIALPDSVHALVYAAVLAGVYIVTAILLKAVFRVSDHFLTNLGIAALNTLVLAIPFINRRSAYSLAASPARVRRSQNVRKQGDSAGLQRHSRNVPLHQPAVARFRGVLGQFRILISEAIL